MVLSLRKKTLFVVTLSLIALTVILYFVISNRVRSSFEGLEKEDVNKHVQRVTEALDRELVQISINAQDNALPGSRAAKMAELFEQYGTTVTPSGLSGRVDLLVNRLGGANVLLLTDTSGKIIFESGYDDDAEELTFIPTSLRQEIEGTPATPLLEHPGGAGSFTGILRIL